MLEELEELKEQKAVMESETKQIEVENQKVPNLKDKAIDKIKEEIRHTEHQISRTEKKKVELNQDIQRVKVGLNALFSVLNSPLEKNNSQMNLINEDNMEESLGKIEKKINFVMKMVKEAGLQELLVENVSDLSMKKTGNRHQMKGLEEFMSKAN
jgi:septal ring factor EnvC (AmiA/AmiB activator)